MQQRGNQVMTATLRLTVLTTKMIRIEYSVTGQFEDRPTQLVQHRDFDKPQFTVTSADPRHEFELITSGFHLYYDGGDPQDGNLYIDAAHNCGTYDGRWYCGDPVGKNLKGTVRTLDKADGAVPLPDGLMSKNGISFIDDSRAFVFVEGQPQPRDHAEFDGYYFAYGHDYLATLRAYYQLSGYPPLIPRFALGNWWSRFYPYHQAEYLALMTRFDCVGVPIAVAVLDMDWHVTKLPARYGSGWTGYTWNRTDFPDPVGLLRTLHAQGRKVTLNVHPAAGIRPSEACYPAVARRMHLVAGQPASFDLTDPAFKSAYFQLVHHPLEAQGVDFWWIDWQSGGAHGSRRIDPLWLLNVAHYQDSALQHAGTGLILSRYAGLGSHRYPVGFSGDTVASWASLAFQPYFTATASNVGYPWWSHDIGGHMHGTYDGELALRWLQLGVFSPILRLHSSNNPFMSKAPWNYEPAIKALMIAGLRLRHQLIPYLDSANDQTHQQGIPLVRPMYYGHGDDARAYQVPNQYQFGPAMIVAPITTPSDPALHLAKTAVWLPAGRWYDWDTGLDYAGDRYFTIYRELQQVPVFVQAGGTIPLNPDVMAPVEQLPAKLTVKIFTGADGQYQLIEHLGTKRAVTTLTWNDDQHQLIVDAVDPQHCLPARQYTLELVGAQMGAVSWRDNVATVSGVRPADPTATIKALIWRRLQFAKISFDLKRTVWQPLETASRELCSGGVNVIQSRLSGDVKGTLSTELAAGRSITQFYAIACA